MAEDKTVVDSKTAKDISVLDVEVEKYIIETAANLQLQGFDQNMIRGCSLLVV